MCSVIRLALAVVLSLLFWLCQLPEASALDTGRYQQVKIIVPADTASGVVLLFSDRGGLDERAKQAAAGLAQAGLLVAEIDTNTYIARLDQSKERCHFLVYDADLLSRTLQREYHFANYVTPIAAGIGEGATLAELALAQAPAATIAGAIAVNPSSFPSRIPVCSSARVIPQPNSFHYDPPHKVTGFLVVGLTQETARAETDHITTLQHSMPSVEVRQFGEDVTVAKMFKLLVEPHLPLTSNTVGVLELPLTELPVQHPPGIIVIEISGDGGWRDLDKTVAENLQRSGIPVVGWDSLRYFWSKRTPQQTSHALAEIMETYLARWHADKVALIGYSFGADVMPFAYNLLPPALRSHVALVSLLALSKSADFQIRVSAWLGVPAGPDALATLPEAAKITSHLTQCIYGATETDTGCPGLAHDGVEVIRMPGGHHFDRAYDLLTRHILDGLKQRIGALPAPAATGHLETNRTLVTQALDWKPILLAMLLLLILPVLWSFVRKAGANHPS